MTNTRMQFYVDTMIVETMLSSSLVKTAEEGGLVDGLISSIKSYIGGKITPGHEFESVVNLLTPGILLALNFPVLSIIVKIAQMWFGLDTGKMLMSAVDKIKGLIGNGKQVTSEQVDQATAAAVQENYGAEPTEADLARLQIKSFTLRDAQLLKVAYDSVLAEVTLDDLEKLERKELPINKRAQVISSLLRLVGLKQKSSSALGKIIGWIIKVVLASAGFMVAGDAINKLLGRTDNPSSPSGMPTLNPASTPVSVPKSSQTIFKVNPNYVEEKLNISTGWIEMVPPTQIGDQVSQWTQAIYPDLNGKDNVIRNSTLFQKVVETIQNYNSTNTSNVTFMPRMFTSRKKVVDTFIDDIASKAQTLPNTPAPGKKPSVYV